MSGPTVWAAIGAVGQLLGAAATAVGLYFIWRTLQATRETARATLAAVESDQDWRCKQLSADMLVNWNLHTADHRQAVEAAFPRLLDSGSADAGPPLSRARAHAIYMAVPPSPDWSLRFHFIELLNYFEYVSSMYALETVDHRTFERSFKQALLSYYRAMRPYILEVIEHRGHNPWTPFTDLVIEEWKEEDLLPHTLPAPHVPTNTISTAPGTLSQDGDRVS